jgi:putative ABC transport system permease protein
MLQDIRYAFRMLKKNPILSVVAILTIALGIGANTAIFSIVNSVLIQPLPYRDSDRLFTIHEFAPNGEDQSIWMTRDRYTAWQNESRSFEGIAALHPTGFNVLIGKGTQRAQGARVTPEFFSLLGVSALHGRLFTAEDSNRNQHLAVLDYYFWQNNFAGDPALVGQSITIDNRVYLVSGILPETFDYHYHQDVWIPLHYTKEELQTQGERSLHILALLKHDVTPQQAQAELRTISINVQKLESAGSDGKRPDLVPLQEEVVGSVRQSLLVFQIAVGFVLLIVCVNMTNLILAQSSTREKEIWVRLALGAGRARLSRQFIIETLLLSIAGGTVGVVMFMWTHKVLLSSAGIYLPFTAASATTDLHVLAFAGLVSVITGLFIGMIPATQLTRTHFGHGLNTGMRSSANRASGMWRATLVISEVALSVILLIGAGLMIKSFWLLQQVNPGFDPNHILKLRIALPQARYSDSEKRLQYYRESIERLKTLPGVESVAMINWLPLSRISNRVKLAFPDKTPSLQSKEAEIHVITPDYFRVMKIPLKEGRAFTEQDGVSSRGVMIVTESFVGRYFPDRFALGQRLDLDHNGMLFAGEIAGVVADVRNEALDTPPKPAVYVLNTQQPWQSIALREFVVRTPGDASALAETARRAVWSIDRDVPVYMVQPMTTVVHQSLGARRFNRNLISTFGFIALILVLIGVYGLMSYSVTQRTREIGVRMALGARERNILNLVLKQGFKIAAAGILVGIAGAFGLMSMIEKLLFGVSPLDTVSFAAIALFIALTILAASYFPARRAAKISPLIALHHE